MTKLFPSRGTPNHPADGSGRPKSVPPLTDTPFRRAEVPLCVAPRDTPCLRTGRVDRPASSGATCRVKSGHHWPGPSSLVVPCHARPANASPVVGWRRPSVRATCQVCPSTRLHLGHRLPKFFFFFFSQPIYLQCGVFRPEMFAKMAFFLTFFRFFDVPQ